MDAKNSNIVVRLLPSFADFAFLMPIVFLFGRMEGMQTLLGDCDTGWHIRTGQWILAHHQVPFHDLFSYSKPGGVWYAWEWLADMIFAGLYAFGGLRAVGLAAILLICASFALLYLLAKRKSNAVIAVIVTMAGAAASSVHWLARPHLFTLFFLVVFYVVLERVREGSERLLWLLIPTTVLWTNLHGGFFVGIAMVGVYGVGELMHVILSADRSDMQQRVRSAVRYFACAAACLAGTLLNPYTYHLHVHVVEFLGDPYSAQHIQEYMSLSFRHPLAMFLEAMLLGGGLASAWCVRQGRFIEPLLYLMWAHAALLASRNIPIAMILMVPMVAEVLNLAFARLPRAEVAGWVRNCGTRWNRMVAEMCETDALPRWHLVSATGVLLTAAVLWAPNPPKRFRAEFDPKTFPAGAIDTLAHIPSARVFTYDQWGDYLIYRLYPRGRVFDDGRVDYYGSDFSRKVMDVVDVAYGWDKTLEQYGVNTVLMPPSSPLAGVLKESRVWRVVYDDGVSVVFRRNGAATGSAVASMSGSKQTPSDSGSSGSGRSREATKTQASDQPILTIKSKT